MRVRPLRCRQLSLWPASMVDEPLYSVAARYHDLMGYQNYRCTAEDFFGVSHVSYAIELPNRLQALLDRAAWTDLTKDVLLATHTAAPYHMAFLGPEERTGLKSVMLDPAPPTPVAFLGLGAAKVTTPTALRYCPACVKADRARNDLAYWRRIHQLPGVVVCPLHGSTLVDSSILRATRRCRSALVTLEAVAPVSPYPRQAGPKRLTEIARDSDLLLQGGLRALRPDHLRQSILSLFIRNDWATRRGTFRSEPIREAWKWRFPRPIRAQLACGLDDLSDPIPFLRALVREGRRKVHPLIAIMLIRSADATMESVLAAAEARSNPPSSKRVTSLYPCINRVCTSEGRAGRSATVCSVHASRIDVYCTDCGLRYQTRIASTVRAKVVEWGWLWDKRLTDLVAERDHSQRAIARSLGVDPLTVRRAADRLGLDVPWAPPRKRKQVPNGAHVLDSKRMQWRNLRADHASAGRAELRKLEPALWAWLYRNDRRWLFQQAPVPNVRPAPGERVNWAAKDQQLALELSSHAQSIIDAPGRPIQITRAELARRAGSTSVFSTKVTRRLPLATAAAAKLVESRETFAARRIRWAASQCMEVARVPTTWELARLAALREDMATGLRCELEAAVQEIEQRVGLGVKDERMTMMKG